MSVESKFKVGDVVLCQMGREGFLEDYPKTGDTYTVGGVDGGFVALTALPDKWFCEDRFSLVPQEDATEEHTGGSSSYYDIEVGGSEVKCLDIIEGLQMSYSEGSAFKAIWRTAAARQGKKKKGNNAVYDSEKVVFFGERMLADAKKEAEL